MASSEVDIANMALGYLGANRIISLDESPECETNYASVRDACLEDRNWSFALKRTRLGSPSTTKPAYGFTYQYLLPTDLIRLISVNDNEYDWVKEGRYVLTNQVGLNISYVYRVEDVRQMSSGFVMAFAARLASVIAIPLTNSKSSADKYMQMYDFFLAKASGNDGRQGLNQKVRRNVRMSRNQL